MRARTVPNRAMRRVRTPSKTITSAGSTSKEAQTTNKQLRALYNRAHAAHHATSRLKLTVNGMIGGAEKPPRYPT